METSITSRLEFLANLDSTCGVAKESNKIVGLLLIDLLEFSRVNAVYGFAVGDQVLGKVLERLINSGFKNCSFSRVGNDEFALVLNDVKEPKLLTLAANKIVRVLGDTFEIDHKMLRVEPVIGIAAYSGEQLKAESLFVDAEKSLSDAKKQNKRFLAFSQADNNHNYDWKFESMLHKAVAANDLSLYYQPKVCLEKDYPTHAEALARWQHPDLGVIGPADFIPILEKAGGIGDLTKWAIHTALREMSSWPEKEGVEYSVAVNVASQVLEEPDFIEVVRSAINIWGVDPKQLTIEITEGALVQEEHSSYQSLFKLKDLGLKISIDDFGTGYSCLSYFKRLPADELKIDRSFVANITRDKDDEHLTQVIIDLAHSFNMSVVAEGVEDEATLKLLKKMGCDYIQGYYFSKPLHQDDYCDWIDGYDIKNYY